jgi:hypothetical protein
MIEFVVAEEIDAIIDDLNIGMNSLVGLFNSEACQSLGVIKREASGKALSGLVRRRRACFFTK